jgi:hypothetical protein
VNIVKLSGISEGVQSAVSYGRVISAGRVDVYPDRSFSSFPSAMRPYVIREVYSAVFDALPQESYDSIGGMFLPMNAIDGRVSKWTLIYKINSLDRRHDDVLIAKAEPRLPPGLLDCFNSRHDVDYEYANRRIAGLLHRLYLERRKYSSINDLVGKNAGKHPYIRALVKRVYKDPEFMESVEWMLDAILPEGYGGLDASGKKSVAMFVVHGIRRSQERVKDS